ncbi:MAG: hypothetical protein WDN09_04295 [bacterium]
MTKPKQVKNHAGISLERLAELRHATLIASTGSSLRLSGSKVTNKQVEQILNAISKPSGQK